MREQLVEIEFTAVNSDCLSGTEVDQPPADGLLHVWVGSTVNTATLETPQFAHSPSVTALIRKYSDGIPPISDMIPFVIPIAKGKHPVVVLGGTTGTVHMTVRAIYA